MGMEISLMILNILLKNESNEKKQEWQLYLNKLSDKELSKRLDTIREQRKMCIEWLDDYTKRWGYGEYRKKEFQSKIVPVSIRVRMQAVEDLDFMEDQVIQARVNKFKN